MKMSKLSSALVLALSMSGAAHAEMQTDRIENVRHMMTFNELSQTDKETLFEQASLLINDIYVNKDQKNQYYGISPTYDGHVDPDAAMAKIKSRLPELSTEQLYTELHKTFASQRDLHLTYVFPEPYKAFTSYLPLTFTRLAGNEVRVSAVSSQHLSDSYLEGQSAPAVGDVLVSYNGKSVPEILKEKQATAQGSNAYGGFVRALSMLTRLPQAVKLAPEEDEVTMTLRKDSGETYDVTLPWLVDWNDNRVPATEAENNNQGYNLAQLAVSSDVYQESVNKLNKRHGIEQGNFFELNPTSEPILNWSVLQYGDKRIGYMKLNSFSPVNALDNMINELVNLVHYGFMGTDGLIVDVRDNPGGYILLADIMAQLFIPGKAEVGDFKVLVNETNQPVIDLFGQFGLDIDTSAGDKYSGTFQFTPDEVANQIGQLYYKPVAVMSNAKSYSAGDMFTCAMQDNGAAVVYGEDPQTGAGGANVWRHSWLLQNVGGDFKPLPDDSIITVSWGQALREKHHKNSLIEDYGCVASVDVSLTPSDLKDGGISQFTKVIEGLLAQPQARSSYSLNVRNDLQLVVPQENPTLSINVKNVEHIAMSVNGQPYKKLSVYAYGPEKTVELKLPEGFNPGEVYQLRIQGLDGGNQPLWNTNRFIVTQ
ncbi:hypothetical protein CS022_03785 [Veronia nyctiphanis]|uniref:Tail specific protease domain-containing protein n=1 Tax=Veronia nyctiphanis TaxID=1278244 RepID=A0A4Q0YVF6_9GAMM|nr:S41 family peptidase [Veronia nyctiphanis]RXJ74204.1 hypothetical protein CS022_03785 [Veronia nyctiphanis]